MFFWRDSSIVVILMNFMLFNIVIDSKTLKIKMGIKSFKEVFENMLNSKVYEKVCVF